MFYCHSQLINLCHPNPWSMPVAESWHSSRVKCSSEKTSTSTSALRIHVNMMYSFNLPGSCNWRTYQGKLMLSCLRVFPEMMAFSRKSGIVLSRVYLQTQASFAHRVSCMCPAWFVSSSICSFSLSRPILYVCYCQVSQRTKWQSASSGMHVNSTQIIARASLFRAFFYHGIFDTIALWHALAS